MTSVVIPAHNEGAVVGRTLDALLAGVADGDRPEIIVVANGCEDDTAAQAQARRCVQVIEIGPASKPIALNAGERVATSFPRIFLDADIAPPTGAIAKLADVLSSETGPLVAVPARRIELTDRPWPVRAYFCINQRLPAFRSGLFGRGMIALSRAGRARFDDFPEMLADDLFLDSLFGPTEKATVTDVVVTVEAPRRTRDLVHRLVRVRRGNAAMRAAAGTGSLPSVVRPADRWAWLTSVVLPRPWLAPAAVVYVVLTVWAALEARRTAQHAATWERDESTRSPNVTQGKAAI